MHSTTYAVANKFAYDSKTVGFNVTLNRVRYVANMISAPRLLNSRKHRFAGYSEKFVCLVVYRADRNCASVITDPSFIYHAYVNCDYVANMENFIGSSYPVDDFLINRNARVCRIAVFSVAIIVACAFCAEAFNYLFPCLIKFQCAHSRGDKFRHFVEHISGYATGLPHTFNLYTVLDLYHFK